MEEQLLDEYVKAVVAERTRVLTERIEELELRLDVYHGNMYDIVAQQNEQLRKALMRFGDLMYHYQNTFEIIVDSIDAEIFELEYELYGPAEAYDGDYIRQLREGGTWEEELAKWTRPPEEEAKLLKARLDTWKRALNIAMNAEQTAYKRWKKEREEFRLSMLRKYGS